MAHLLILAHGGSWDRRFQVSSLAASAAASGDRVTIALFFGALEAWASGGWDRIDPEPPLTAGAIDRHGFPPLGSLLEGPRGRSAVRILACSASTRLLGLEAAAVQSRVDALVGWPAVAELIAQADRVVTF